MSSRLHPLAFLSALGVPLACDFDERPSPRSYGEAGAPAGGAPAGGAAPEGGAAGAAAPGGEGAGIGGAFDAAGGAPYVEGGGGGGGAGPAPAVYPPLGDDGMVPTSGDIEQVHDPFIIEEDGTYYLFSTGVGVSVRTSTDLLTWTSADSVFAKKPAWITTTDPSNPAHLWAPEVRHFGGKYHLYYSASRFGSNRSCIGHATRASLGQGDGWVDQGEALICSNVGDGPHDYNAIDPSPFEDESGQLWLAFGSFWGGLKLLRLDDEGRRRDQVLRSLATRANKAVEAPHFVYRDGYYYLFQSVDSCCQGASSTYKTMVGRSASVTGPYLDRSGNELLDGAATMVLQGGERYRGPGHNAILRVGERYLNVYHAYDVDSGGAPVLRIAELTFSESGWPISAGP